MRLPGGFISVRDPYNWTFSSHNFILARKPAMNKFRCAEFRRLAKPPYLFMHTYPRMSPSRFLWEHIWRNNLNTLGADVRNVDQLHECCQKEFTCRISMLFEGFFSSLLLSYVWQDVWTLTTLFSDNLAKLLLLCEASKLGFPILYLYVLLL